VLQPPTAVTTRSTSNLSPKQVSEPLPYGHITCGTPYAAVERSAMRRWTVSPTLAVHKYSSRRLAARVTTFCTVAPHQFRPLTHKSVCQFTRTERKASDSSEFKRSLQNCESSVRNLLHVTLLAPTIYNALDFWKICAPLIYTFHLHNPSGRTIALGSTQPLTEISAGNISWGVKGGR
jgi:hypothetical protein